MAQVLMMPRDATFRTISKASAGTTALRMTPSTATPAVRAMPPYGTPDLFIRAANFGAEPETDMERMIRPVE